MATQRKKIAIIGGGLCGIACIFISKEEDHEPVCFEATDKYGGTFCYREKSVEGVGSLMPTTVLNNNKELGACSILLPRKEFSCYLRHSEFYQYLTDAYKYFKCEQHMRFNSKVVHVKKSGDYEESGRYLVTVKDQITGGMSTDIFDAVMVATGHFNVPKFVKFPGQEKFKGNIMHTHSLKSVQNFKGKNVLVIGIGCSALDAAVEASSVAKNVYVSSRSGAFIMNRSGPFGYPLDWILGRRYITCLLDILPRNWLSRFIEKLFLDSKFDHRLYYTPPKYHCISKDPVINDAIGSKLLSGSVVQKRLVKYFTESGVVFDGEENVTEIDDVIFGTGYTFDFPFLDEGLLEIDNGRINLYKCMYPPQLPHPTLVFVGFINPFGPGIPVGELQIRWAIHILSGKATLPSEEEMMKEVIKRHKKNEIDYSPSEINSLRVDWHSYMEDIASEIGVKPNLIKYLFTDFPLFLKLAFGPIVPYQYRLEGPHKWEGARNAIMTSDERLFFPLTKNNRPSKGFFQALVEAIGSLIPKNIFF